MARVTRHPRPVAEDAQSEAPEKIHGVSRHASVVNRLRATLKFYQGEMGQCPFSDIELGRELHAQRHEVSGSLAHLKNYGEVTTVVRSVDETDPRVRGRELRVAHRAIVYLGPSTTRRSDGETGDGDRTDLNRIAAELEEKLAASASKYRAAVNAARKEHDDAIAVARAQWTIARIALRRSASTINAAAAAS